MLTIKSIHLDYLPSENCPRAQALVRTLQGKSYLDIQVKFAPVGGSVSAIAEGRAKSEKELRGMVMSVLISALSPTVAQVRFCPGTGGEVTLPVSYITSGGVAKGPDGCCAFCKGDPCNENSSPDSPIARYYTDAPHAATCPFCDGRPS